MGTNMTEDAPKKGNGLVTDASIWAVILIGAGLWAFAVVKWGVLGLFMPAVVATWVMLAIMVWLSRG
ncbi:hypothetical protein RGUI_3377 [Rhodovulum sp. P5]|uniref:hypothetical protein n=1 Tax=Rhodovulum sp. P5 TaxID=1564506 RepID=UPI0009C29666|nr:hypothetical protein [Rhodovulum sp. P5]ARE41518.1 hypothetical protein RGUI_3377 [Rhodovulum sp. P5]